MDGSLKVDNSVYIEGKWFAAQWLAEVADPATGELVLTATVDGPGPVQVTALKLDMATVRGLRRLAGFEGLLPGERAEEAEADLRYWRESVAFAVDMLRRGRAMGELHRAAIDAESYLRQLLELDGAACYDCRTNAQRLAELEARIAALETNHPTGHQHDGGHWIPCPFCPDDEIGMCSACNGTRRIWEMPREDAPDIMATYDMLARRERAQAAGGA